MSENELLSVEEVAKILRVDASTVRRLIYRHEFPDAFKAGRAWRILRSDLRDYIKRRRGHQIIDLKET